MDISNFPMDGFSVYNASGEIAFIDGGGQIYLTRIKEMFRKNGVVCDPVLPQEFDSFMGNRSSIYPDIEDKIWVSSSYIYARDTSFNFEATGADPRIAKFPCLAALQPLVYKFDEIMENTISSGKYQSPIFYMAGRSQYGRIEVDADRKLAVVRHEIGYLVDFFYIKRPTDRIQSIRFKDYMDRVGNDELRLEVFLREMHSAQAPLDTFNSPRPISPVVPLNEDDERRLGVFDDFLNNLKFD